MRRLALALLAALLASPAALPARADEAPRPYDWVFYYHMAYDNDLERCGPPILSMLQQGLTSDRVAVVVTADGRGAEGMRRLVLTRAGAREERLDEEGSAEEEVLAAELAWVSANLPAEKYAVVFLDHGGALGQMSFDERPRPGRRKHWLYPPAVGRVLAEWRRAAPGEVELVFYQQCGKGSLENYYAFKDAARVVMGSQTTVGAPNGYYAPVLREVAERPELGGLELAALIARHEPASMFTNYAALDAAALAELPARLDAALAPLLAVSELRTGLMRSEVPSCFGFPPEQPLELFYDGLAVLERLYRVNDLDRAPLEAFAAWVGERLVRVHRVSPRHEREAAEWCGFSLFVPLSARALAPYQEDYSIYRDTRLAELHRAVIAAARRELVERARRSRASGPPAAEPPAPPAREVF